MFYKKPSLLVKHIYQFNHFKKTMDDTIDSKSSPKKGVGRKYAQYVNDKGKHVPGRFSLEKEMAVNVPFKDK